MSANKSPGPWLITPRLRLREFTFTDRNDLVSMHKNPRVRTLLVDDYPLDRHVVAHELIKSLQKYYRQYEGLGIWCAERMVAALNITKLNQEEVRQNLTPSMLEELTTPKPRFAGWFNLMPMTDEPEEVELGSRLLPEVWGSGLALEGGEQLLTHAFGTLNRDQVWAVSHVEHRSVRYCVTALGFREHGIQLYDGKPAQYYVINQSDWCQWKNISRKNRQRYAIQLCREISN